LCIFNIIYINKYFSKRAVDTTKPEAIIGPSIFKTDRLLITITYKLHRLYIIGYVYSVN